IQITGADREYIVVRDVSYSARRDCAGLRQNAVVGVAHQQRFDGVRRKAVVRVEQQSDRSAGYARSHAGTAQGHVVIGGLRGVPVRLVEAIGREEVRVFLLESRSTRVETGDQIARSDE